MPGIAQVMLTKQNGAAKPGDIRTFTQQGEVPGAIHVSPYRTAPLMRLSRINSFLHTLGRILQHQGLVALLLIELSGGEQIDAGRLELGGRHRTS